MVSRFFGGPVEIVSESVDDFNMFSWGGCSQTATKDRAFSRAVERVQSNFRQSRGCS